MKLRGLFWLPAVALMPAMSFARAPKPCVTAAKAAQHVNKDSCVSVHIYDVVEVPGGTGFLDVCSPQTPDAKCRFTIVIRPANRGTVGALSQYRDKDVQIRGIVQSADGFSWMELSDARQFHGGRPKFTPNSRLARGFSAEQSRPPIYDPNFRRHGGRRAYTNSRNQETLPAKK
jgi:hypothetical protein